MGARTGAPRFELADIVEAHRASLEESTRLGAEQRRVLTDIARCRTAALGGHLDVCDGCGYQRPSYNSCRNRHCPKCQALAQQRWIELQHRRLLDAPHFHVVFTLPEELRPLAKAAPRVIYDQLFRCAGATLREFASTRQLLLGATLVLHTWTKELHFHPHVHCIVVAASKPERAAAPIAPRSGFLFPVKAMSRVFRGKMRAALRRPYDEGAFRAFGDFRDPEAFDRLSKRLAAKDWYVYSKRSFTRAKHVVEYLGRYTHRIGLSNARIVHLSKQRVVIRTRGDGRAAMHPVELLRRAMHHVLPVGLHKIRHVGLYSNPHARARLDPGALAHPPPPVSDYRQRLYALTGRDVTRCPCCGDSVVPRPLATARAPP